MTTLADWKVIDIAKSVATANNVGVENVDTARYIAAWIIRACGRSALRLVHPIRRTCRWCHPMVSGKLLILRELPATSLSKEASLTTILAAFHDSAGHGRRLRCAASD